MGANNTNQSAKGIYTFTQKEEVEYTYGVAASSWEEAKELVESYSCSKINMGDFMGGNYIGETQMRRAKLIRKMECAAAKFTLFKPARGYKKNDTYHNCSSTKKMIVPVSWYDGSYQAQADGAEITGYDEKTGCCTRCASYLDRGFMLIPHVATPEDADYTTWEVKPDDS